MNMRSNEQDVEARAGDINKLVTLLMLRQAVLTGLRDDHPHKDAITAARDSVMREIEWRFSNIPSQAPMKQAIEWLLEFGQCCDVFVPTNGGAEAEALIKQIQNNARFGAGWQPMDFAPHDKAVLVWCPHLFQRVGGIVIGQYLDGKWKIIGMGAGWELSPTHWMPLPANPRETTRAL